MSLIVIHLLRLDISDIRYIKSIWQIEAWRLALKTQAYGYLKSAL